MNSTGISQFNQARVEWAIRLRYSPMPKLDMELLAGELNAFRIGELRTVGKTWEVMMERDGELAINSEKRKADSACLEWQISSDGSPDGDKHAAALQYFYNNLSATKALDQDATGSVDELVFQTLSAVDFYYSAHEILLRIDNPAAKEITAEFRHTPIWFFEARRGYLGYLKHIFDMYGQPCIAGEWLTAVNTGWMRQLTMPYCAKWMSMRDWLLFGERYGSGFLEAITDATNDSKEWNDAQAVLNALANDGLVLHNRGVELKFLDQPSRNQLPFQPVVELVDRLYAKCYRGVDLATGSRSGGAEVRGSGAEGGKNAVGASVQKEESGILLVRDAKWITGVFNDRIDRPILRYLFNEEPRAWFALLPPLDDTSSEDLQSLQTLVPMGLRVALKEVYKRFRWSVPGEGDPCLRAPQAPTPEDGGSKMEDGKAAAAPSSTINPQSSKPTPPEAKPEQDVQTQSAKTTDDTPIAPGADPARNPGLVSGQSSVVSGSDRFNGAAVDNPQPSIFDHQSASRQMPDTQVDAGAFWSRVGLAPRGADGQTLPMPSLGYAVPNETAVGQSCRSAHESGRRSNAAPPAPRPSTPDPVLLDRHADLAARGLANCRAAQALKREINRRRFEAQNSKPETDSIALSNWEYDPNQPRDRYGKWTTGDNAGNSTTNKPAPANLLTPLVARPGTQTTPRSTPAPLVARPSARTTPLDPIQNLSAQVGESKTNSPSQTGTNQPKPVTEIKLNPLEEAEYNAGPDGPREYYSDLVVPRDLNPDWDAPRYLGQHPLAAITAPLQVAGTAAKAVVGDLAAKVAGYPDAYGNISAFLHGEELPIDRALRDSALEQNFRGEVPVATVMGRVAEGVAATLPTMLLIPELPPGLKQAPMAKAAMATFTVRMAAETPEIFKQLGEEYGKPPDQRDPNKIDSLLAEAIQTIGFTALGGVGLKRALTPKVAPANAPSRPADIPRGKPPEVPSETQAPEPSPAPLPPFSAAERQTLEADIQARRPISMDTLARVNASGGVEIPRGYRIDFPNNRLVYIGTDNTLPVGSTPGKSPTPPPEDASRNLDPDAGRLPSLQGNVPNPMKWRKNGGSIAYKPDGSMTYTSAQGISVNYNPLGYPDLTPYLYAGSDGKAEVQIDVTGDRGRDNDAANAEAGFSETPPGYTWHHNENVGLMQLIDEDVHADFFHSGGVSVFKKSNQ